METISAKKVVISYVLTSVVIFAVSVMTSMLGLLGQGYSQITGNLAGELMVLLQLGVVLVANGILHSLFYYGGMQSSPITKGLSIGIVLGVGYFLVSIFALNLYDINSDPISLLIGAMSSRIVEYCSGGIVTAIISVSDIHRWGLLRAF